MTLPSAQGMAVQNDKGLVTASDVACRACASCLAAHTFWCQEPRAPFRSWTAAGEDENSARAWLGMLAALVDAPPPPGSPVLVLSGGPGASVVELIGAVHDGPVIASLDGRDSQTRSELAGLSSTGRAATVASPVDGISAVRSVERGGSVYLADTVTLVPTVTDVVQRYVSIRGPRTVDLLDDERIETAWARTCASLCRRTPPHPQRSADV